MKKREEVLEALKENRKLHEEFESHGEELPDEYIYQGWVEALEFVLDGNEEPEPETFKPDELLVKAFDLISVAYLQGNFYPGSNGIFSHVEEDTIEEDYHMDSEDSNGWSGWIKFGQQDETSNESYDVHVFISESDFELWKKEGNMDKFPEWIEM